MIVARLTLVVILDVAASRLAQFQAYERAAARIMARYGGKIERVIAVSPGGPDEPLREVHVVTFPDAAAFEAYRSDAELATFAPLRAESVLATSVLSGEDRPVY